MKENIKHLQVVAVANTPIKRLKGLMFKREEEIKEPLVIVPCRGVHTCFMRTDINILVLDKENRVIDKYENVTANRVINGNKRWHYVIEFTKRMNFDFNMGDIVLWGPLESF